MDSYSPIYDAVRQSLRNCDVGAAVESALSQAGISHCIDSIKNRAEECFAGIRDENTRPSVLFRPYLLRDGDKWCVLLGPDLQSGVAGFGDSPDEAMREFDKEFYRKDSAKP